MTPYIRSTYNCSQHAVSRFNEMNGTSIEFKSGDEWQRDFIRFLSSKMERVLTPSEGNFAVMSQQDGSLHLGVFTNHSIEHNYKPSDSAGCVIISDIGTINAEYKNVRYYQPKTLRE